MAPALSVLSATNDSAGGAATRALGDARSTPPASCNLSGGLRRNFSSAEYKGALGISMSLAHCHVLHGVVHDIDASKASCEVPRVEIGVTRYDLD